MSERAAQLRRELQELERQEQQEQTRLQQEKLNEIEHVWAAWIEHLRALQVSHPTKDAAPSSLIYNLQLHPYVCADSQYGPYGGFDIAHTMSVASYAAYRSSVREAHPTWFQFTFESHETARASILPQDPHHCMLLTLYGVSYTISWQRVPEPPVAKKPRLKTSQDLMRETLQQLRKELDGIEQAACNGKFASANSDFHVTCTNKTLAQQFHRFILNEEDVEADDLQLAKQDIKELQNHPWSMAGTEVCDQAVLGTLKRVVDSMRELRVQHLQTEPSFDIIESYLQ